MSWVRSEYAGELAVLSTWLTALLPWSVSYFNQPIGGRSVTVINIRFVLFQFHYVFGISLGEQGLGDMFQPVYRLPQITPPQPILDVCSAVGVRCRQVGFVPANQQFEAGLWLAAAVVFAALLALSVVYYAREDWLVARSSVDLVRLFGGAFAVLALAFTAATVLFFPHQITVPVGTLFMWVFAVVLLRIDRT